MSVRQVVKFIWNTRHCAMLSYEMAVPFMFHFIKFKLQNVGKHKPDPSMCKWLPKVSFPSITSALENLWPTQWSPFHYVTTNFGCADWHVKMSNDVQPFHRIKGTVRQPGHSLFPQHWSQSVFFHCIEEKLAWITGSFLILHTLRHNILLENPSSQPCIGKP